MKRRASIRIASQNAGESLLDFLCDRFTYHGRNEWEELIRGGRVHLNGVAVSSIRPVRAGDRLEYLHPDLPEPPVEKKYSILFEDQTLLVVDKPPNLPCHPAGRYFAHTLWNLLKSDHPMDTVFFVNRIDRETSGIVLIAKSASAAIHCQQQLIEGALQKKYLVMVEGDFSRGPVRAEGFLKMDENSLILKKQRFFTVNGSQKVPKKAKKCCTLFHSVQTCDGKSLISAEPVTGRMHQIRATLCSLGYPVTGDKIYGVDETLFLKFINDRLTDADRLKLSLSRQALHAESLELTHPESGKRVRFFSHLPEDMACFFMNIDMNRV
ncbi:MAG: RluA family pseudouridine synthase [Deltaproteobacteria bacterium]|nr:RluA family pseudouridine synthase [Deltaproteobacteria bacterium]